MKRYKVLVLTDHSGHSEQNSIYAIINQLRKHPKCHSIHVASRGLNENAMFFDNMNKEALLGCMISEDIKYTQDGADFSKSLKKLHVEYFDMVLMRLPRPISDEFLLWMDHIFHNAVIINRPKGIITTSTKEFLLNFPKLCSNMRLCTSVADIKREIHKYPVVLKPLKEYGGRGLLKVDENSVNDGNREYETKHFLEAMAENFPEEGYLSMKYLKNVNQGDKRILVVGGEILAASLRLPALGSWLCNVAQGGVSKPADVSSEEQHIVEILNPQLKEKGVLIYGVDTLVDDSGLRVLSEINTLSIGGFPQAEKQTGKPIIRMLIEKIFVYADEWTR
ncbi:MAG: glutathione synthetase [Saprospiraceae bacterium]|nr:glutathione synthetase [Saprospiraceae bacterium]